MTLDELRVEAKAHGYRLVPIQPYIKLLPCACGRKRIEHWYLSGGGEFYKCPICGQEGAMGKNDRDARFKWNELWR